MQDNDINKLKNKLVLKPILISIIGFIIVYTIFHWFCLTYYYNFEFAEEYLNGSLYLFIIVLLNLFVFIPRLNLLLIKKVKTPEFKLPKIFDISINNNKNNEKDIKHPHSFELKIINIILLNILIFLTMHSIQDDLNSYFSKITKFNNLSEIYYKPPTKYYMAKNFYIDISGVIDFRYLDTVTTTTGYKWTRRTETNIYDVSQELYPLYDKYLDTINKAMIIGWVYKGIVNKNNINFFNYDNEKSNSVLMDDKFINNYNRSNLFQKVIKTDKYFIRLSKSSREFKRLNELINVHTSIDHKNLLFEYRNEIFAHRTNSIYFVTIILSLAWLFGLYFYIEKSELESDKLKRVKKGESIYLICIPNFSKKNKK